MDIILVNVNKSFEKHRVLNNLNLRFPEGKCSCIMGPSGCGKTTLLNILLGLLPVDSGEVHGLEDKHPVAVFQENRLLEQYDAYTNIRLVCRHPLPDRLLATAFHNIGLSDYEGKPVIELSGGMKRRVVILRALMADSDLILMDEPFKGLDAALKQQVIHYVREKTKGKTLIFVTHDSSEAEALADMRIDLSL